MFEMQFLGGFRIAYQGKEVADLESQRLQSLLAYLVLHRQAPQPRQQVAFLFWPDSAEAQARSNLRRELTHLRKRMPAADRLLWIGQNRIQWRPDAVFDFDVRDFEDEARQADEATSRSAARESWERAVLRYHGDLLPGCYDEWILPERERLRQTYGFVLERLVQLLDDEREYALAIRYGRRLLELDPLQEASYRKLMRLYASNGERAGAVHVYHRCAGALERELDIEPSQETQTMYSALLDEDGQAAPMAVAKNSEPRDAERPSSPGSASLPANLRGDAVPLVGRHVEFESLLAAWRRASGGDATMVALFGEAGIGKTRLAEDLVEWAGQQGMAAVRTRCYAAGGRLPFAPVADLLRQDAIFRSLLRLDDVWLTEVSRLVPELLVDRPNTHRPEPLREAWQRNHLFESLARAVLEVGRPLLLLFDDLQWIDPDTLEWLHYLLRHDSRPKILVVSTIRSEESSDNHDLTALLLDLRKLDQLVEVELGPLSTAETAELAGNIVGRHLDHETRERLFEETEGQPLFVVERARMGIARAEVAPGAEGRQAPSAASGLPAKVHAVIAARLSQLSPRARDLLQLAATVGRAFTFEVLDEATDFDEDGLVQVLDELWQRRIVREQGGDGYDFSHDRIREVAYLEASPVKRRAVHRRVAQALELLHRSDLDGVSADIAAHYEKARQSAKAIAFYRRAAEVALRVYANEEAIRLLRRALGLLEHLPDSTERDMQELELQLALSSPLSAARGYPAPELEAALERGRLLGEELGQDDKMMQSLWGLWTVHFVRANLLRSRELAERMHALARRKATLLAESHHALGGSLASLGELADAKGHFEQVLAHCGSRDQRSGTVLGSDLRVFSHSWMSHTLWLLGSVDQAAEHSLRAIDLAEELAHPYSLALANAYAAILAHLRREPEACRSSAEAALALCRKHGFAYYGEWGLILHGWVLSQEGATERAIASIEQGLASLRGAGAETRRPYYLSLLADVHRQAGRRDDARKVLDEALATAERNHDSWWSAELYRLRGELSGPQWREACLHQALEIARRQGSRSLELRAAVRLAHSWREQGRTTEACDLVGGLHDSFTEGHETPDLQEARALLNQLQSD